MFALIVTVISIVLVGLAALATLYYGGPIVNQGGDRALISRYLSEGQQVQGALELFRADIGSLPTGTNEEIQAQLLAGHYLQSWPPGSWELRNDYAVRTDLSVEACTAINHKMDVSVIPVCGDPAYFGRNLCCTTV